MAPRCSALTGNNRRCKHKAKDGSEYCATHMPKSREPLEDAQEADDRFDGWSGGEEDEEAPSEKNDAPAHEEIAPDSVLQLQADKVALELRVEQSQKEAESLRAMLEDAQKALQEAQADMNTLKENNARLTEEVTDLNFQNEVMATDNAHLSNLINESIDEIKALKAARRVMPSLVITHTRIVRKAQALYYHDHKATIREVMCITKWSEIKKVTNTEFKYLSPEERDEYMCKAREVLGV